MLSNGSKVTWTTGEKDSSIDIREGLWIVAFDWERRNCIGRSGKKFPAKKRNGHIWVTASNPV